MAGNTLPAASRAASWIPSMGSFLDLFNLVAFICTNKHKLKVIPEW